MAYTVPRPRGCTPRAQGLYKPYSTDCHAISITYIPEDHTGINLKDALTQTLADWELDEARLVH